MFGQSYLGLPLEIYEKIFSYLKLSDLKECTLVSREWLDSLEVPVFWRRSVLVVSPENCKDLPHSRRIRVMEFIKVGNFENVFSHHEAIRKSLAEISRLEGLALKTLKFSGYKFGVKISLPLDLQSLSLLTKKVVTLDLSMVNLQTEELQVIFEALTGEQKTRLRRLNIRKSPVTQLSLTPAQLADVPANKLEELNMSGTLPTPDQVTGILQEIISTNKTSLRSLNIASNPSVGLVCKDLLRKAVSRLREVNLTGTNLDTQQIEGVLREVASSNTTTLERLCLGSVDMSEVDSAVIGVAACKLKKVQLWNTNLQLLQLNEIFKIILKTETGKRLRFLDLEGNDVHSVSPETLGKAVLSLTSANLHNCKVTAGQVDFIFDRLAEVPPSARTLSSITLTDMQSVNYKENQRLHLNLDILRGHKMFLITKRFLQFHGLNDKKKWQFVMP